MTTPVWKWSGQALIREHGDNQHGWNRLHRPIPVRISENPIFREKYIRNNPVFCRLSYLSSQWKYRIFIQYFISTNSTILLVNLPNFRVSTSSSDIGTFPSISMISPRWHTCCTLARTCGTIFCSEWKVSCYDSAPGQYFLMVFQVAVCSCLSRQKYCLQPIHKNNFGHLSKVLSQMQFVGWARVHIPRHSTARSARPTEVVRFRAEVRSFVDDNLTSVVYRLW